ncbi:uncharacterized protein LOC117640239 [Thrips palmi]|uniref:Uncharacterized protein LOC117640239 n=1 Tax=Thrips palmi TaxID=161013 RepID=A0A6P8ZHU6_THRPL|nr:uncharacterized protein LOC117640239 [Thrips palmi]
MAENQDRAAATGSLAEALQQFFAAAGGSGRALTGPGGSVPRVREVRDQSSQTTDIQHVTVGVQCDLLVPACLGTSYSELPAMPAAGPSSSCTPMFPMPSSTSSAAASGSPTTAGPSCFPAPTSSAAASGSPSSTVCGDVCTNLPCSAANPPCSAPNPWYHGRDPSRVDPSTWSQWPDSPGSRGPYSAPAGGSSSANASSSSQWHCNNPVRNDAIEQSPFPWRETPPWRQAQWRSNTPVRHDTTDQRAASTSGGWSASRHFAPFPALNEGSMAVGRQGRRPTQEDEDEEDDEDDWDSARKKRKPAGPRKQQPGKRGRPRKNPKVTGVKCQLCFKPIATKQFKLCLHYFCDPCISGWLTEWHHCPSCMAAPLNAEDLVECKFD